MLEHLPERPFVLVLDFVAQKANHFVDHDEVEGALALSFLENASSTLSQRVSRVTNYPIFAGRAPLKKILSPNYLSPTLGLCASLTNCLHILHGHNISEKLIAAAIPILFTMGANFSERDDRGKTPLEITNEFNLPMVAESLEAF
ncbi:MAG: hypothetical protein ACI9S8_003264 [Chlamydiales bacterium]|jgi:hypothetical protein